MDSNTNKQAKLTIAITTNLEAQLSTPTHFSRTRSIPETLGAPDGCSGCREGEKRTEEVVGVSGESANLFSLFFEVNFRSRDLLFMFYNKGWF